MKWIWNWVERANSRNNSTINLTTQLEASWNLNPEWNLLEGPNQLHFSIAETWAGNLSKLSCVRKNLLVLVLLFSVLGWGLLLEGRSCILLSTWSSNAEEIMQQAASSEGWRGDNSLFSCALPANSVTLAWSEEGFIFCPVGNWMAVTKLMELWLSCGPYFSGHTIYMCLWIGVTEEIALLVTFTYCKAG